MKSYEFEKLNIGFGQELSFLDMTGTTRYGSIKSYDPSLRSIEFIDKENTVSETIYLKDVETIFLKN